MGAGALGFVPLRGADTQRNTNDDIRLAVATYSLREFRRDLAIKMMKDLGVRFASVKEYHLPYNDTPKELADGRKKFQDAGIEIVAGGVISLEKDDDADIRRHFDYAKVCGMPVMSIAPTAETMPRIERFVKEYNIKIAIHNHGPEDKIFPSPLDVLKFVKNLDPRMGCCIDVGHCVRAGTDVIEAIDAAGPRLFNMHMKDLTSFTAKESQVAVGEGKMPVREIFEALIKIKYSGWVDLEYEIHGDDPMPGVTESFAYMRGVLAGMGYNTRN